MPKEIDQIKAEYKERYGFVMPALEVYKIPKGLSEKVVRMISEIKGEPTWMTEFRLRAFKIFQSKPMPSWGADLSQIDFSQIHYYVSHLKDKKKRWEDLPQGIKDTFDKLGIPEAEKKILAGVEAQYDSEVIYHSLKKQLQDKGIIFLDTDTALKEHPEILKEYFGKLIPPGDNKFAALNSAVWSGGSFIYVPKGVKTEIPLQAYFRINSPNMGQFERTLIIADEGSEISYIEGCSAPIYTTDSLHAAVVEIFVKAGAKVTYTTIQNWSDNVYNLVTKRSEIGSQATMRWIDGNIGSKITMKYPSGILKGAGGKFEVLSFAFAGKGQIQDTGGKAFHLAPNTTSRIISKTIARDGGKSVFRGLIKINRGAKGSKTHTACDGLMLDNISKADTFPNLQTLENDIAATHEATLGKIGQDQLFYLMSRGLSQDAATALIVNGFLEPVTKELPLEYALELNRLMGLEIKGV